MLPQAKKMPLHYLTREFYLLPTILFLTPHICNTCTQHNTTQHNQGCAKAHIMKIDKEFIHPSHPNHKLKMEYTETPFCCDGCREAGIGLKYRCDTCDFDLHKVCAMAPNSIAHAFYKKCEFRFYYKAPGPYKRACDACRKEVQGFVYHCTSCGFDLHPCCANLPLRLDDNEQHNFYLCEKLSSACHRCGNKGLGWSYRSECKNYSLHVSCVKEMLVESWQTVYLNQNKNGKHIREAQMSVMAPSLKGTLQSHHKGRVGKAKRCCQMATSALRVIISAILGDPTAIIAAVIGVLLSK
ncbi:nucleoredoxin 1-2 [Carex littledalei]|uniref:Nucleoredoxin 1-2 n=1 Tax=Carex littledalei TaxID=544730 RepID=A0A833VAQ6_9POAL|nr:nucleoredoxin 1-2 [Carex littledalei]